MTTFKLIQVQRLWYYFPLPFIVALQNIRALHFSTSHALLPVKMRNTWVWSSKDHTNVRAENREEIGRFIFLTVSPLVRACSSRFCFAAQEYVRQNRHATQAVFEFGFEFEFGLDFELRIDFELDFESKFQLF